MLPSNDGSAYHTARAEAALVHHSKFERTMSLMGHSRRFTTALLMSAFLSIATIARIFADGQLCAKTGPEDATACAKSSFARIEGGSRREPLSSFASKIEVES